MINRMACLALSALALMSLTSCTQRPKTNLVFISMDTTRADHIGAYGYDQAGTASIDALAGRGFLFRRHLTPAPVTLPSHASMFTGQFPPTHTVRDNGTFVLPDSAWTLAEALQLSGFDTSAFVGAFPLTASSGINQGFAHYDDSLEPGSGTDPMSPKAAISMFFDERPAGAVVDAAIAYHRERKPGRFFTFLHFFDPHQPLQPPPPYDIEFRARPYDGEIAYVDEQIGRFLSFLEQRGELQNTIVVITADHGEGLGEHGEMTHSTLLHQATLRVPLIIAGPGIDPGETDAWTSSTQLFSTLCELLGVELSADQDSAIGHSLLPLIANHGVEPPGWPVFESYFETIASRAVQGASQLSGWMEGDDRLIFGPRPELFDLRKDPRELDNRHAREPELAAYLFDALRAFLQQKEKASVGESAKSIDATTMQRLAGLGYVQSDPEALQALDDMLKVDGLIDPKDTVADVSLYSEARSAAVTGNWLLARELFTNLLERLPDNAKAHADMAMVMAQLGDVAAAAEHLELAQRASPKDSSILRQRAWLAIEQGQHRKGLDLLLAQDPERLDVSDCIWIASAFRRLEQSQEADTWLQRCSEMQPDAALPVMLLANAMAARGDAGAEALYRQLLGKNPYFALGFYNYGKWLLDHDRQAQAKSYFERAATLNPNHAPTQQALELLGATQP